MKRRIFPKKAKLITQLGFTKIIKLPKYQPVIYIPLLKKISVSSIETGLIDINANFEVRFAFDCVRKGFAEYLADDVVKIS